MSGDLEEVTKPKKPKGFCGLLWFLLKEYAWGFKMVLTNPAAALCLIGIILRIWETAISSNLMSKYINVYQTPFTEEYVKERPWLSVTDEKQAKTYSVLYP